MSRYRYQYWLTVYSRVYFTAWKQAEHNSWRTADEQMTNSWRTAGEQLTNSWRTADEQLANSWQTAGMSWTDLKLAPDLGRGSCCGWYRAMTSVRESCTRIRGRSGLKWDKHCIEYWYTLTYTFSLVLEKYDLHRIWSKSTIIAMSDSFFNYITEYNQRNYSNMKCDGAQFTKDKRTNVLRVISVR